MSLNDFVSINLAKHLETTSEEINSLKVQLREAKEVEHLVLVGKITIEHVSGKAITYDGVSEFIILDTYGFAIDAADSFSDALQKLNE